MDAVERLLEQTASSTAEGKVVYVARIPWNAPAPDGIVVRYLLSRLGAYKKYCSAYHAIIEGSGFGVAVKRGIITSLLQFSQTRSMVFVHAHVDSVLAVAQKQGLEQVRSVLEEARRKGMLAEKPQERLAAH